MAALGGPPKVFVSYSHDDEQHVQGHQGLVTASSKRGSRLPR